jgi:polyhydroxyalkanoate synthesis regulator phasin
MAALLAGFAYVGKFLIGTTKTRSDLDAKRIDALTAMVGDLHEKWRGDVQKLSEEVAESRGEEKSCRDRVEALSQRLRSLEEGCRSCPTRSLRETFEAAE